MRLEREGSPSPLGSAACPRSSASTFSGTESGLWSVVSFRGSRLSETHPRRRCRRPALHLPARGSHTCGAGNAAPSSPRGDRETGVHQPERESLWAGAGPQWEERSPRPARPSDTPRPAETRLPGSRTGFACALGTCSEFRGARPLAAPASPRSGGMRTGPAGAKNDGNRHATSAPQSRRSEPGNGQWCPSRAHEPFLVPGTRVGSSARHR